MTGHGFIAQISEHFAKFVDGLRSLLKVDEAGAKFMKLVERDMLYKAAEVRLV